MAIIALVMIPAATTSSRSVHGLPNCAVSRSWMTERSWRTTVGKSRKFMATLPKTNLATVAAKEMPIAGGDMREVVIPSGRCANYLNCNGY